MTQSFNVQKRDEPMSERLANRLWNVCYDILCDASKTDEKGRGYVFQQEFSIFYRTFWGDFLGRKVDEMIDYPDMAHFIKNQFIGFSEEEKFLFIEFFVKEINVLGFRITKEDICGKFNVVLESEKSQWRFSDNKLVRHNK